MLRRGKRLKVLEDKSDPVSPEIGQLNIGHITDAGSADKNIPGCRGVKAPHKVQKGGFAGAGRPHDRDKLATVDPERDTVQCSDITCGKRVNFNHVPEQHYRLIVHGTGHFLFLLT